MQHFEVRMLACFQNESARGSGEVARGSSRLVTEGSGSRCRGQESMYLHARAPMLCVEDVKTSVQAAYRSAWVVFMPMPCKLHSMSRQEALAPSFKLVVTCTYYRDQGALLL